MDIAMENNIENVKKQILEYVNKMYLTKKDEQALRMWLSGESDVMPDMMPDNRYVVFFGNAELFCYMSKVCEFTARLCVYGILKGYVDLFREPVKEIMRNRGLDGAKDFLDNLIERYSVSKKDVMQMYSAVFVAPAKTKEEKIFYAEYVEQWMESSKEEYIEVIAEMGKDWHKKILKKLEL